MCFSIHVDKNIKRLAQMYGATINEKAFSNLFKMQAAEPKKYKYDENEQRVYIKDWAPILTRVKDELEIRPMRYQLLPHFCEEEKYIRVEHKTGKKKEIRATYNARLDSIETRKAWKKPFLNFHGLVIMDGFFEWVLKDEKKVQIKFTPINNQHILT
ncbi:MAG: putative SOS response-associated peptidase YedK, partial [Thermoproteota archaeon]